VVVVLALILWQFLHFDARAIATLATIATVIIIRRMPTYMIVSTGKELTVEDELVIPPRPKESRWFLVLLISLVTVILAILVWAIWSSI
jgi:hypothetical protein